MSRVIVVFSGERITHPQKNLKLRCRIVIEMREGLLFSKKAVYYCDRRGAFQFLLLRAQQKQYNRHETSQVFKTCEVYRRMGYIIAAAASGL